ncbi:MAG: hypothetical protein ACP5IC_02060 [Minisyncoccia bacterium]
MARGLWKNNIHAKEILLTLAKISLFTIATTSPYFLHSIIKKYFKEQSYQKRLAKQKILRKLEQRKYISFQDDGRGNVTVVLTHKGKTLVHKYNLETMQLQKPKHWDNKWRILFYDIPTYNKKAADAFRQKLKQLNIYQLQKSVWISPYDFIKEIEFLCGVFNININRNIIYLTTSNVPKESMLKKHFHLI